MSFRKSFKRLGGFIKRRPIFSACCAIAGIAVVGTVAAAVATGPVLASLGFGPTGIAKGSYAAATMSGIGSVAATSLFATLQSAGAGGHGVAMVAGAIKTAAWACAAMVAGTCAAGYMGGGGSPAGSRPCPSPMATI